MKNNKNMPRPEMQEQMKEQIRKFKCRVIFIPGSLSRAESESRNRIREMKGDETEIKGSAIITRQEITFLGGVDDESGKIIDRTHELYGKSIAGRILIFPKSRGSTVGSYVIYGLSRNKKAPLAMIVNSVDNIVLAGAIIARIPLIKCSDERIFNEKTGKRITINLKEGYIYASDS